MKRPCTLLRSNRPAISPWRQLRSGTPTAHERAALPLLPSGPGGIRRFPLRGAQPSTPPHEAHSTPTALEREFNPAEADCGLQGTANSPSSTVTSRLWRRGRDLNPRHRGYPCTAFPVPHLRPLGHPSSDARPAGRAEDWRRGEDLNPRGTFWAPIRFRVGRLQPGSATPPRCSFNHLPPLAVPPYTASTGPCSEFVLSTATGA